MSIQQHVNVTAAVNNAGVSRQGFGTIGVLSYGAPWPERKRSYRSLAAAIADGFPSTSPEARSVGRIFAQSPHAVEVAVLKGTRKPTQKYTLAATVHDAYVYGVNVKGQGVTDTAVTATSNTPGAAEQIHSALLTGLNAVAGKNYLATFAALAVADEVFTADSATDEGHHVAHTYKTGDGPVQVSNSGGALPTGLVAVTNYWLIRVDADNVKFCSSLANALAGLAIDLTTNGTGVQTLSSVGGTVRPSDPLTITGSAPGNWFSLEIIGNNALVGALALAQTHADPGIADDLTEIQNYDKNWYYLETNFNSPACVLAAADWIESTDFKAYMPNVVDTLCENQVAGNGDIADELSLLDYKKTLPIYHRKGDQCIGAGLEGVLAPKNVGTWTAAYKSIAGCTVDTFTDTQTDNLDAKRCSYYKSEGGRSFTWQGMVGNTAYGFLDVTVSLDFVIDDIQKSALGVMVALDKVAYTDEDIAVIRSAIEGAIARSASAAHKIIAPGTPGDVNDPVPTVTFPKVSDIDPSARALRNVPDGTVNFRLQGAVHTVAVALTVTF